MNRLDAATWSYNWQYPRLTSFGASFPDSYDGPFLEFWKRQLEGEPEQIIDLACGNGALTWIFDEILNAGGRNTRIAGVDFADIRPFAALGRQAKDHPMVRFIANTPIERLPFASETVDLAASQYGLEYSSLDQSVPELGRVLKPRARMSFVLHDKQGYLVTGATRRVADFRKILDASRMPALLLELDEIVRQNNFDQHALVGSPRYQAAIENIERDKALFSALLDEDSDVKPLLAYMRKLSQTYEEIHKPIAERSHPVEMMVADAEDSFRKNIARLEDLAAVALDAAGRRRLADLVERQGFRVLEMQPLCYRAGEVWGTTFVAVRGTEARAVTA